MLKRSALFMSMIFSLITVQDNTMLKLPNKILENSDSLITVQDNTMLKQCRRRKDN